MPKHQARSKKVNGDVAMNFHTFFNSEPDGAEQLGNSFYGNVGERVPSAQ
jgi:hypothetical protein